jgi:hypothetical protein
MAKELRVMARALGHDRKLQDLVERAAENAEDARDSIRLPRKRGRTQPPEGGLLAFLDGRVKDHR